MREIDTDALRTVLASLGIGNPATATAQALFDDGVLQQVYDVSNLIRRARSPSGAEGLYMFQLGTDHPAGSDTTQTFTVNPYTLVQTGGGITGGLWPNPVPDDLDVWILGCMARLGTGASADFDSAQLDVVTDVELNAFSSETGAADITSIGQLNIATFTGIQDVLTFTRLTQLGTGKADIYPIGFRVPRKCTVQWRTRNQNSGAIQTVVFIFMGIFASGLGQDGLNT